MHIHRDAASLDYHLEVIGPRLGRFADLLTLSSIHIYGDLSAEALGQLQQKIRLLGSGEATVHASQAGFIRPLVET